MLRLRARHGEGGGGLHVKPRTVYQAVGVLCAAIFAADAFQRNPIGLSTLYAIPIVISLWAGLRRFTLLVCGLAIALALFAQFAKQGGPFLVVANLAASVFTIAVVTSLGLMRMRVERKLDDTRRAVITTLTSIGDAVITADLKGKINFVNPVAERLTAYPAQEALGKELDAVLRLVDERPARLPVVELDHGAPEAFEAVLLARDGRRVPVEETRAPIRDVEGKIYGHVRVFRDVSERREHEEAIKKLAYRDELTGLPNRTSLHDRLQLELAHARRNREKLAVMYLDLDRFKEVNDTFGHHAGDEMLEAVAERLRASLRGGDTVARLGGDEFVLLLPGVASVREAQKVGEKILETLRQPLLRDGRDLAPGGSMGLAVFPADGSDPDTLLRRADKAMYRAKQLGGNRIVPYAAADQAAPEGAQP